MARRSLGPATLAVTRAVQGAWREPARDTAGGWLVGCSGGADSLALAVGALGVCRRADAVDRLGAVVVDHALQPGSDEVARTTRERLVGIGYAPESVAVVRVRVDPDRIRELGPEAAARAARYAAFRDALDRAPAGTEVLLAHSRDDQAETVLLGLLRGSGIRSLSGMAPRRGPYVRPLLDLSREQLRACCSENGLAWWEDPANADDRYLRVRLRHEVLPLLQRLAGGGEAVDEALARTAALARADADFLDDLAEAAAEDVVRPGAGGEELDCAELAFLPAALRGRVIHRWLVGLGSREPGAVHVAAVAALVTHWHGQRGVDVPGLRVQRQGGRLRRAGRAGDRHDGRPGDV